MLHFEAHQAFPTNGEDISSNLTRYWKFTPIALAILLGALTTIAFFPGFMSFDSLALYAQAIGHHPISTEHPPITVYVWRLLMYFWPSPGVLLVFNQLMYWSGILLFSLAITNSTFSRVLIILIIGLCPPLFAISLHLWADAGMMNAMALAVAAIAMHQRHRSLWWLTLAVLALFYATAIRYNAAAGTIPLFAFIAWRASATITPKMRHRISVALCAFVVILGSVFGGIRTLNTGLPYTSNLAMTFLWDMAAISIDQNKDLIPLYIQKTPGPDFVGRLHSHFDPNSAAPNFADMSPYLSPTNEHALIVDWTKLTLNNLGYYLARRTHVFLTLLSVGGPVYYPFHSGIDSNSFRISFAFKKFVYMSAIPFLFSTTKTLFYRVWFYAIIDLAVIFIYSYIRIIYGTRLRFYSLSVVTAASGFLMEAPLFIFAPCSDYRYSIWMVFSALLASFMTVADLVAVMRQRLLLNTVSEALAVGNAVASNGLPSNMRSSTAI